MQKRILLLALIFSQPSLAINNNNNSSNNKNFSITADFLYWTISEVGTDNWAQVISPYSKNQTIQFLDLNFDWQPGFRAGMQYFFDNRAWDTRLYYTWYQTKASQAKSTNTEEIHSAFSGNFYANNTLGNGLSGPYYHQAAIKWNFLYQNIDWEIGRMFDFRDYQLRPYLGLKAAFLNQSIDTTWQQPFDNSSKTAITNFSLANENIINDFWGVGPVLGLHTQADIVKINDKNFGLIGDFSASFLGGGWHISDVYENNTPVNISTINNVRSSGLWMTRGLIGINWEQNFKNINLLFKLSYEAQMWTNQLKFYSFDGGRQNNTLYTQGGVLNACIHF